MDPFIRYFSQHAIGVFEGTDKMKKVDEAPNDFREYSAAVRNKIVGVEIIQKVDSDKLSSIGVDDWGCKTVRRQEYCDMEKKSLADGFIAKSLEVAKENDVKETAERIHSSAEWLEAVISRAEENRDSLKSGFLNNFSVINVFLSK
jgi:hypothetical protein